MFDLRDVSVVRVGKWEQRKTYKVIMQDLRRDASTRDIHASQVNGKPKIHRRKRSPTYINDETYDIRSDSAYEKTSTYPKTNQHTHRPPILVRDEILPRLHARNSKQPITHPSPRQHEENLTRLQNPIHRRTYITCQNQNSANNKTNGAELTVEKPVFMFREIHSARHGVTSQERSS